MSYFAVQTTCEKIETSQVTVSGKIALKGYMCPLYDIISFFITSGEVVYHPLLFSFLQFPKLSSRSEKPLRMEGRKAIGVLLLLVSLCCLGTWPARTYDVRCDRHFRFHPSHLDISLSL